MARKVNFDFSIVGGKLEKFRDTVLGSLIINFDEKYYEEVSNYLKKKNINFSIIDMEA